VVGSCEYGDEPSSSTEGGRLISSLFERLLGSEEGPCPMELVIL
jgi:hypothetical protein